MLSYSQWKSLNESVQGVNLGLGNVQNLGLMSNQALTEEEFLAEMKKKAKEAKKKMRKKMGLNGEDDGEVVPPAAKKDLDPDADLKAKKDSEDGDDEKDDDDDDDSDNDADGDGVDDDEEDTDDFDDEDDNDSDDDDDDDEAGNAKEMAFMKKKGGKKAKKVKKEEVSVGETLRSTEEVDPEWLASVVNQLGYNPLSEKQWDGMGDHLKDEPQPGEIGFAPTQRIR